MYDLSYNLIKCDWVYETHIFFYNCMCDFGIYDIYSCKLNIKLELPPLDHKDQVHIMTYFLQLVLLL